MRTPLLLLLALSLVIGIIYYAGNIVSTATPPPRTKPTVQHAPTPVSIPLTADQARQLSSEQRIEGLRRAASIEDADEQAESLLPLIEALTKEELPAASAVIDIAEKRVRGISDRVLDTLGVQWGRVDPVGYFKCNPHPLGNEVNDPGNVMRAWLETDSDAALAWAWAPPSKETNDADIAAAYAITRSAAGDPQKLVTSLQVLPTGDGRIPWCLEEYFNLVTTNTGKNEPAVIYDNLPAALLDAAWPIAMRSLAHADPQTAVDWLNAHINDPGRDYHATYNFVQNLAADDPAGIAQWAALFPEDATADYLIDYHPAYDATCQWLKKDPVAAKAWLQSQPPNLQWVGKALKALEAKENPNKSQEENTKD